MLQTVQLQTPDGVQAYPFIPNSLEYEAAVAAGEITEGMDIVYRNYLVHIIHDSEMLVLTQIAQFVQNPMGGMQGWTFTVNGIPVDPNQFMDGGTRA